MMIALILAALLGKPDPSPPRAEVYQTPWDAEVQRQIQQQATLYNGVDPRFRFPHK
jgi:hypothetical protein